MNNASFFPQGSLLILVSRDGSQRQGTITGHTDSGIVLTDASGAEIVVSPDDLVFASYLYVGFGATRVETVEVPVAANGHIESYDAGKGFVNGLSGRYLFRKDSLLGSLAEADLSSLSGRPVLYLARGVSQQVLKQIFILDATSLDKVLDEVAELASRGRADIARAFCKLLSAQFPDDADITSFIRQIDQTCFLDLYQPLPPPAPGFLTPRGRIARSSDRSGLCVIDVASHEQLFVYPQQLMGDLYDLDDDELIGLPVCYTITKLDPGYQARTIIRSMSFEDALQYARDLKDKFGLPLNARDLVRMVRDESGMAQARFLFDQWSKGSKLWEQVTLPPYVGEPRTRNIPMTNTVDLHRATEHSTVTETVVEPELPLIRFGEDAASVAAVPVVDESETENAPKEDVVQQEVRKESPAPKTSPQPEVPDIPEADDPFSLERCPDGDEMVSADAHAIYRYRMGTVYALRNGVTRQYTFNLEDLMDSYEQDLALRNQYMDRGFYDRYVLCLLDDENEKAFCICAPGTVRELLQASLDLLNRAMNLVHKPGDPEALALFHRALGYAEIVLKRFPAHPTATLFRSHIQSLIQSMKQTCFKAPQGGLKATGLVSTVLADGSLRLTDAAYPRGLKLMISDVVDRDYNKPRLGDELVYAVYVDNNGKVYPRFAHLARTPDELLVMADSWAMEGEIEKAWGIVMNILDTLPENEGALSRKREYESALTEEGTPVVSLSCQTRRNKPLREDPFAAAHRERMCHHLRDAIRLYRTALSTFPDNDASKKSACIRNIVEMYGELYHENPADAALLADYRQFGTENLLISGSNPTSFRLIGSSLPNLDLIIRFYEDVDDAPHLAQAWLQKKAFLQHPKQRLPQDEFRVKMADVDANISWNYIRSGRIEEASQALRDALDRDSGNGLALKCRAVVDGRKLSPTDGKVIRDRLTAFNLEPLALSDNPIVSTTDPACQDLVKERFRLLFLLKDAGRSRDAVLARYIATLLESPADYPLATSRMAALPPDCQLVGELYGCTRKGITWQGWADIQLACNLSVEAARSVCKFLYCLDPDFMRAWLLTFPFAEEGGKNATWSLAFSARMFQEWRKMQYEAYVDLISSLGKAERNLATLEASFERISKTEQELWLQRDDAKWASSCGRLSIRIDNYLRARNSREIHDSFTDVMELAKHLSQQIDANPTVLSYLSSRHLLQVLKEEMEKDFDARHFVAPVPEASLVSVSDVKADGRMLAVVAIQTQDKAFSMGRCELSVIPGADIRPDGYGAVRTYSDVSKVYGGEPLYYLVRFRVGQDSVGKGGAQLNLNFSFDVEGMTRQKVPLQVDVPVTDDFVPITNPYSNLGSKEENPARFYGREKDVKEVVDALSVPGTYPHFLVYGQKRSGKSSLLFHVQRQLDMTDRFLSAETDFLGYTVNREEDIYYHILIRFRKVLQAKNRAIRKTPGAEPLPVFAEPRREETTFESFQDTFDTLKDYMAQSAYWKDHKIVLFIDEFTKAYEWLLQGCITSVFLQHWKSLSGKNLFCAVLIGQDTLSAFMDESGDRNAFDASNSKRLSYLTEEGAKKLVTEPFVEVTGDPDVFVGEAVNLILRYSACSAYHTKWICGELIKRMNLYELKKITEADVEEAVRDGILRGDQTDVKKLFDPLTSAGLNQKFPGRFTAAQAERVLATVADDESRSPKMGCHRNHISDPAGDVSALLNDLLEREVLVSGQKDYYLLKVKLYLLWAQRKLRGSE